MAGRPRRRCRSSAGRAVAAVPRTRRLRRHGSRVAAAITAVRQSRDPSRDPSRGVRRAVTRRARGLRRGAGIPTTPLKTTSATARWRGGQRAAGRPPLERVGVHGVACGVVAGGAVADPDAEVVGPRARAAIRDDAAEYGRVLLQVDAKPRVGVLTVAATAACANERVVVAVVRVVGATKRGRRVVSGLHNGAWTTRARPCDVGHGGEELHFREVGTGNGVGRNNRAGLKEHESPRGSTKKRVGVRRNQMLPRYSSVAQYISWGIVRGGTAYPYLEAVQTA